MKQKLKIGILIDNYNIPFWSYKMVEELISDEFSEIVLIVKSESFKYSEKFTDSKKGRKRKSSLWTQIMKLDRKLFSCNPDAFEQKDIRSVLLVETINVPVFEINRTHKTIIDLLEEVRNFELDILINLKQGIPQKEILSIPKYGVWSIYHGDNHEVRGEHPGVWEVFERKDETGAILQILQKNPYDGIILTKSFSKTDSISPNRNRNNYYWKVLSFIPEKIRELSMLGESEFFRKINEINLYPQFYSNRFYYTPDNLDLILNVFDLLLRKLREKFVSLIYFNQWILLYNINNVNSISTSFYEFKKLIPPKDRFWADPHVICKDGKYYVFVEELLYSNPKGHISLIVIDELGNCSKPVKVLEREYHLSYPFLIEDNEELYMIPETRNNSTIELYKCVEFPYKWEFERALIDNIQAVDATVIFLNGKYWLFANVIKNIGASSMDELYIFESNRLLSGSWKKHPQNPVISDFRKSRPAGNFFYYKDKLYRPSQDSSKHYGYGMKINQVIELNEMIYEEKEIDSILPNWDKKIKSTHTISSTKKLTIIDAEMRRRKWL